MSYTKYVTLIINAKPSMRAMPAAQPIEPMTRISISTHDIIYI